jgi:hypothetical protein
MDQPLRNKRYQEFTDDLVPGENRILEETFDADVLSDLGSVDKNLGKRICFRDCGCNGPVGGRCGEDGCGSISCTSCHGRCCICAKPLCQRHSTFVDEPGGSRSRYCSRCHRRMTIRRRALACLRLIAAPFCQRGTV